MRLVVVALLSMGAALSSAGTGPRASSVVLESDPPSPAPVGAMIEWTARVSGGDPASLWCRFRVRPPGGEFRTVRDFGPSNSLEWTAADHEGRYEIEVAVKEPGAEDFISATAVFDFLSRAGGGRPVISPTRHPLVWLYSAPECPAGNQMRVHYRAPEGIEQFTAAKPCRPGLSMNFYLAGMRPNTAYTLESRLDGELGPQRGEETEFTPDHPDTEAAVGSEPASVPGEAGVLLHCPLNDTATATDMAGNVVWFHRGYVSKLTRMTGGGTFLGIVDEFSDLARQTVSEFDLTGMTLRETNAARVNEQLAARGHRRISGFHHEAAALPGGRILVLAAVEQILENVQGPGPVNVLGDMIIVLDPDLQVEWVWDAFDHLDPRRAAVLGQVCTAAAGGCPTFFLTPRANDWLHGNSVQLAPDGNLLFSIRHQDWVVKIDYLHGQGTGQVLWRLGKDGDFRVESTDSYPWFSHQHDAGVEFDNPGRIVLFDNGNTRRVSDPAANSRGQSWELDEENRVARLVLNADLGAYSAALGSAQKLATGNYQFGVGFLPDRTSASVEVDAGGRILSRFASPTLEYRTFRLPSLYQPF